jgi:hypothetical protein
VSLDEFAKGARWGYSLAWAEAASVANRRGAEGVIADCPHARIRVQPREGGRYSLYCFECGEWVPNTANYEMQREGCFAHSHSCEEAGSTTIKGPWLDCANHAGRKSAGKCPNCLLALCPECLQAHEGNRRVEGDCHARGTVG